MVADRIQHSSSSTDAINFTQLIPLIWQRRRFVLLVAAIVMSLVMAITMWSTVTFTTASRMYLGELTSTVAPAGEEAEISPTINSDVSSEVEILTSRSLIGKAILQSGVNARLTPVGEPRTRYWRWRLARRDPLLADRAVHRVRAVNTDLTTRAREPKTFLVRFTSPEQYDLIESETGGAIGTGRLGERMEAAGVRVQLNKGAGTPVNGDEFELTISPLNLEVDEVLTRLSVSATKSLGSIKPSIVSLSYTDTSPLLSAEFLKSLMNTYLDERQQWKTQEASAAEAFVTSQMGTVKAARDKAQKDLADFRSNNRVVVLDSEAESMIGQISRYEEQRVASRLEAEALADVERALKTANPAPEAFMLGEAQDTVLAGLATSLSESRRKLTELETRFNSEAPDVISQRDQVKAQLATIRSYVSNRLVRARENLGTLSGVIGRYEQKLKTIPGAELQLAQLTRESEVYDTMYAFLLKRQQQAAISKASTVSKNRVLDQPEVPFLESSPRLALSLASAPFGLLLGILMVLLGNFFSSKFQSARDVFGSLGATPVFAVLPQSSPSTKQLRASNERGSDVLEHQVSLGFLEAFRTLRTNLYLVAPAYAHEGKVLLVTSPSPGDGKTTCALSLAWMFAADGKKVLVIDADLRKPSHFLMVGRQAAASRLDLRSVLSGECSWQEAAHPVSNAQRSIYSLGVSEAAPAELLSMHNLRPLLSQLRKSCDYIILDSPSFPLVSDALVLAPAADAVLSVIRPDHTPRRLTAEHLSRLREISSIHAAIVNDTQGQDIYGNSYPVPQLMTRA